MEWVLLLLNELREETLDSVINPPVDQKTEFGFGRVNGMLFAIETIRQRVTEEMEAQARTAERREADFDKEF